jgi:hypothetical protein
VKLTSTKKLVIEDFPSDSRDLVKKLAQVLNPFLDQVNTVLGTNLTIGDNLKAQQVTRSLMAGTTTCSINWTLNERPSDVRLAQLSRPDGSTPTAVFSMYWTYSNGVIKCTFLGLDSGKAHNVTIVGQV